MEIKQSVLEIFENNPNTYLSGESMAKKLYVSRNAIWKAVNELKKDGYDISAVTNKGYCMNSNSGILSRQSIEKYAGRTDYDINVYKTLDSTNDTAKEAAEKGAKEWTVIIAEEQKAGKGRLGRHFCSPSGTGLYMSIVLKPTLPAAKAVFITAAAAVATAEAIESVSGRKAQIKWVNDIYCDMKKICGILTQGVVNMETGFFDYAILGIGVNVFRPEGGFPKEIEDIADAVFYEKAGNEDARSRIAAEILNRFAEYYRHIEEKTFVDEYRRRSFILGHDINVIKPNKTIPAVAKDISDDCGRVVEYEDKSTETLSSGEVSIKIKR